MKYTEKLLLKLTKNQLDKLNNIRLDLANETKEIVSVQEVIRKLIDAK